MTGSARDAAAAQVSRETLVRLDIYHDLLLQWTKRINLIAPSTHGFIWDRHFSDGLVLWQLMADTPWRRWADVGSGGGVPGLVVAILAAGARAGQEVVLVESDQRKCAFLRTVSRETGVPVTVETGRVEAIDAVEADVISARALAPLPRLLELTHRHVIPGGVALFPKGQNHQAELAEAAKDWAFDCTILANQTEKNSVVLRLENIRHV